jgi:hypothetical protein
MKKIITLLAAAGMVVAASAPASAVDVKMDYRQRISFQAGQEKFDGQNLEQFKNRVRLGLTMAASENLKGYVQFQLLNGEQFGQIGGTHGDNDATVRQMYIDWKVPSTAVQVRMGRQEMGLPADAFGENAVMAAGYGSRDGIVVTSPVTDWLSLTALWHRVNYDGTLESTAANDLDQNSSDDIYAAVANMKFNGVSASVYAAYATIDGYAQMKDEKEVSTAGSTLPNFEGKAYWVGFTSTFSFFDPFTLKLSAAYGTFEAQDSANDTDGWNVQAKASYKTAFGTPVLGGWYISGMDEDGEGYMPNAGYWAGTNHLYDGYACLVNPSMANNDGNWAVQAGIEGMSFLSGLTHDFHVTYMKGTNDEVHAGDVFLTEDDAVVEFTLNNVYKMYKNLSVRLELAYVINDFGDATTAAKGDDDDWFAGLTFDFRF